MNLKRMILVTAAAATPLNLIDSAYAHNTYGRWGSNKVVMRAASVSFPVGAWRDSLQTVVNNFYRNPSNMWFEQWYGDTSIGFGNGQSEVWFSSSSDYNPAVTFWWTSWWSGDIVETDVVFYNGEAYTTSMNKTSLWSYGGAYRPFQTTAMHEYGHAAGLLHESDEYNIMGQDWTHIHCNGSTCTSYVGEDACNGLVSLYGACGCGIQDVGVSVFEWSGRSGEYSTHNLCDVYTTGGSIVGSDGYDGQRRYYVSKGTTYQFEFTYENNGESTQTFRAGYYLSSNNYISTGDRFLGWTTFTLSRDDVYYYRRSLTIPSDLTSGSTYYLGVIVDDTGALGEVDEQNAVCHVIRIN